MSRPESDPLPPAPRELAKASGATESRVEIDGISIRYLRAGSGPPLLLIHGLLGFSFSWRKNIEVLSRIATVYAPDLPGTGYSRRCEYDCSFAGTARIMARFLDALGAKQADVIGSSHGGAVAMMLASMERVRRMVLVSPVNPFSIRGKRRVAVLSSALGGFLLRHATPALAFTHGFFLRRLYGDEQRISPGTLEGYAAAINIPGTSARLHRLMRTWPQDLQLLRETLPRISDIPTLLVWGDRDTAVPVNSAEPLRQRFRDARLVVLPGAGHLPYEEMPQEFNAAVVPFLMDQPLASRNTDSVSS